MMNKRFSFTVKLLLITFSSLNISFASSPSTPTIYPLWFDSDGDYSIYWTPSTGGTPPYTYQLLEMQNPIGVTTDDFEGGTYNWNLDGFVYIDTTSNSPTHSLFSGNTTNLNVSFVSKSPVKVTTSDSLTFWCKYGCEPSYDFGYVDISPDGANWSNLTFFNGIDLSWQRYAYSLTSYADSSVYFRFRYTSDGSINYGGFYVDDIYPAFGFTMVDTLSSAITDTSFTVTGRTIGQWYYYKVRTKDNAGEWSSWSNVEDIYVGTNTSPTITVNKPSSADTIFGFDPYTITWTANDPDNPDAKVSLYFDTDNTGYDGKLIVNGLPLTTTNYAWNGVGAADSQTYYIYAKIEDGVNPPVYDYSAGTLTIKRGLLPWTILVFLNADNNLDGAGVDDMNEMEAAVDTTLYNVIVQFDRASFGSWTTCRRYKIHSDTDPVNITSPILADLGEVDMGDPNTLADFVKWGINNYPAKHYFVIAWDHGSGWYRRGDVSIKDFSNDDSHGSVIGIANGEWESALTQIKSYLGRNIDLWGFDACLMGMQEVDYVAKDYIDVMLQSEETEPGDGYPYNDILNFLNVHPDATPQQLDSACVAMYVASYSGGSQGTQDVTQSGVNCDPSFTNLSLKIDDFARELIKVGGKTREGIANARSSTQYYYYSSHIDLYDFASEIYSRSDTISLALKNVAQAVMDALGFPPTQIGKPLVNSGYNGASVDSSYGIAIYYPTGAPDGTYANLRFAKNNTWWPFINGSTVLPSILVTYNSHSGSDTVNTDSSVTMYITLRNSGANTATSVSATLSSIDTVVTITANSSTYPDISSESTSQSNSAYSFDVKNNVEDGHRVTFELTISATGFTGTARFNMIVKKPTGVEETSDFSLHPSAFSLSQNYPNPFSSQTAIRYSLSAMSHESRAISHTTLKIYNIAGQVVKTLVNEQQEPGYYVVKWDGKNESGVGVASGVYFYRLYAGDFTATKKMILLR